MERTATVVFDGETLKPDGPIDMKPNTRYVIRYEDAAAPEIEASGKGESIWDVFRAIAGTVEAPEDWSAEHDHYIHGAPKRADQSGDR